MAVPLIMQLDGTCRRDSLGAALPPSDQLITIDLPVGAGPKARNKDADVKKIQAALNRVRELDIERTRKGIKRLFGGPLEELKVDGIIGPKTRGAINRFQTTQFKSFDTLIEPGRRTINRLNQILFANLPVDPSVNVEIRAKLVQHLANVTRAVKAAQANCLAALTPPPPPPPPGPNPPFVPDIFGGARTRGNDRLNRHFDLNKLRPNVREIAIRNVLAVYNFYDRVLVLPGALGAGAFDVDPSGDFRIAFSFSNGFHRPGEISEETLVRVDRIHVGRRAFFAIGDGDFAAHIMLHEMAHFVGFPGGAEIPDHARGWFTDPGMKQMSVDQHLHNADCYANFAHECRTGSKERPPFLKASGGGGGSR